MRHRKICLAGLFLAGITAAAVSSSGAEDLTGGPDPKIKAEIQYAEALQQLGMPDYMKKVLDRLVSRADACVNLIGIIREASGRQTFHRLHTLTTRAVVEACEEGGVPRLLQMSALGVKANAPTEYQRTKYEGEEAVQLSRLDWTIFRPGLIHGSDGEFKKTVQSWCWMVTVAP